MENSSPTEAHSRLHGMSLAKRFYTEENIYYQDVKWLRANTWLMVGHESQIRNPGAYFLYEFDQDSVIVIRGSEDQIGAFHNVCRHRGSRLCTKDAGNMRALTCPYHAWTYGLDGRLRSAPFTPKDFDRNQYALLPCHVRVHCGVIFLSFAQSPPDFDSYIGFLTRELELQDVQHSKVAKRALFSANANWKLVVENNLECYHCGPAHATFCSAHPGVPLGKPQEDANKTLYEPRPTALRDSESEKKRQFTPMYTGNATPNFQFVARSHIGKGCSTESVDGKSVAPLMGLCTYEGMQTIALPSPLTNVVLNPDYVVLYAFTPRSVRRTDIAVIWLVNESAVEGVDFDVSQVSAVWEPTLKEDKILAENTQLGIDSTAYRPGPYIETEKLVGDFDLWYLRRIRDELTMPGAQEA